MKEEPLSVGVGRVSDQLVESRRALNDLASQGVFEDRLKNVSGLLTCGISTLYEYRRSIAKFEVEVISAKRGKPVQFSPRGIGMDVCPGCFVCGSEKRSHEAVNDYLHNIAGYVQSKEDAEIIIGWFGGKARLDSRPERHQLKFGACDKHLANLRFIGEVTNAYGVIRKLDVDDAVAFVEPEVVAESKPGLDSELEELADYLSIQFPATVGHIPLKEKLSSISSRLTGTDSPLLVMSENDSSAKCPHCKTELVRHGHLFVAPVKSKSRLRRLSNKLMCLSCEKEFNFLVT